MKSLSVPITLAVALALVIPLTALTVVAFGEELQVIVSYWLQGRPRMLVRLDIELPSVDAERCLVLVRRFPTPYNPTKDGWPEDIYFDTHTPGTTVAVKRILFAHVAKYEVDPRTGEYRVGYYEPQEFLVAVGCVGSGGETVFRWSRVVEVFPRSIIHVERVKLETTGDNRSEGGGGGSGDHFTCSVFIEYESGTYKRGSCLTWVRGPSIYSIEGLSVSFGLEISARISAVYLESFGDSRAGTGPWPESEVSWSSAGRKLTPTVIARETNPLSGGFTDVVYFTVRYRYEYSVHCKMESCLTVWTLYPYVITALARSAEEPTLPYRLAPYTPPPIPWYASRGLPGSTRIFFEPPYESDTALADAEVTFEFSFGVFSLTVSFYKAGRSDSTYTTPYVRIDSTRYYWWWYRDDDRMTYEVLVAPR
ncbi:MAG: hypothetical protein LM571_03775 [Desulfurococcaceae archaeon]|nr:hypothetical protein [Desulfurococcaceae archaeon]